MSLSFCLLRVYCFSCLLFFYCVFTSVKFTSNLRDQFCVRDNLFYVFIFFTISTFDMECFLYHVKQKRAPNRVCDTKCAGISGYAADAALVPSKNLHCSRRQGRSFLN